MLLRKESKFEYDAPKYNDFGRDEDKKQDQWFNNCKIVETPEDNYFQHNSINLHQVIPSIQRKSILKESTPKMNRSSGRPNSGVKIPGHLAFLRESNDENNNSYEDYQKSGGKSKQVTFIQGLVRTNSPLQDITTSKINLTDQNNQLINNIDNLLKKGNTCSNINTYSQQPQPQPHQFKQFNYQTLQQNYISNIIPEDEMPVGWEMKRRDDGKIYYADHNSGQTHWVIPPESLKKVGQYKYPSQPPSLASTPDSMDVDNQNLFSLFKDQQKQRKQETTPLPSNNTTNTSTTKQQNDDNKTKQRLQNIQDQKLQEQQKSMFTSNNINKSNTPNFSNKTTTTTKLYPSLSSLMEEDNTSPVISKSKVSNIKKTDLNNKSSSPIVSTITSQKSTSVVKPTVAKQSLNKRASTNSMVSNKNLVLPKSSSKSNTSPPATLLSQTTPSNLLSKAISSTSTSKKTTTIIPKTTTPSPPSTIITQSISIEKIKSTTPTTRPITSATRKSLQRKSLISSSTPIQPTQTQNDINITPPMIQQSQASLLTQSQILFKQQKEQYQQELQNFQKEPKSVLYIQDLMKTDQDLVQHLQEIKRQGEIQYKQYHPIHQQQMIEQQQQQFILQYQQKKKEDQYQQQQLQQQLHQQQQQQQLHQQLLQQEKQQLQQKLQQLQQLPQNHQQKKKEDRYQQQKQQQHLLQQQQLQQQQHLLYQQELLQQQKQQQLNKSNGPSAAAIKKQKSRESIVEQAEFKIPKTPNYSTNQKLTVPKSPYLLTNTRVHPIAEPKQSPQKETLSVKAKRWRTSNGLTRISPFQFACDKRLGSHSKRLLKYKPPQTQPKVVVDSQPIKFQLGPTSSSSNNKKY